jgi:outer membrane protein OmpA-like peptidoglycan-associated protein
MGFLLGLLTAGVALADSVSVTVTNVALLGKGQPTVNITILEPIMGFMVKLKRSDGKDVEIKGGGKPGQTRNLELNQPEGKFSYTGELSVNLPKGGTETMQMQFDAELWGPLHMKAEKADVDIEHRKIKVSIDRPAAKAVVKVMMDTGKAAFDGEIPFNGAAPNTPLEITWPEKPGKVMKVSIQVYDTLSFFSGVEFFPWQIDIPHEEVSFDSGKWDIKGDETEKVDSSYVKITDAVNKYGRLADIKLYVAGHTDTVGANAANRTLSLNRAKAIGLYLRKRGLSIPVFYEGFGEEAPAVQTPDETAEAGNRRADYTISIEAPRLEHAPFQPTWHRL